MSGMKRHTGKLLGTDQRVVVVMMQIPGREDHALVCPTDSLPPRFEHAVQEILESPEGQADEMLANVLSRRFMPDSKNTVLEALHLESRLLAVPVSRVVMMPHPSRPYPLTQILEAMGRSMTPTAAPSPPGVPQEAVQKFNPHEQNRQAHAADEVSGVARSLIAQAEMMESDAAAKRAEAYRLAPSLRPTATVTNILPEPIPAVVEAAPPIETNTAA